MPTWFTIPDSLPVNGQQAWVRRANSPTPPFLAVWSLPNLNFQVYGSNLTIPWYDTARWRPSTEPPPATTLVVSGSISPDITGIYTWRCKHNSHDAYQLGDTLYWICYPVSASAWYLQQYPSTARANAFTTLGGATPSVITGTYTPIGTYSGNATVAWPT